MQIEKAYEQVTTGSPNSPAFPARVVYGLFCALPGVHDLVVTVIGAMREHRRQLGTSQGVPEPHSFAVRVGIVRPMMPPRPPHPASRFVTTRNAPRIEAGRS